MRFLFQTSSSWSQLVLRVILGAVFFPHGAQKLLGWFGGYGFSTTLGHFTGMGIPAVLAILVILGESLGSLGLIAGFLTRFCAMGIGLIMLGAIPLHIGNGFFMNWFGNQKGEGIEFHLLALAIACALMLRGGGRCSLDRALSKKMAWV